MEKKHENANANLTHNSTTYDEIPYHSNPFNYATPERLQTISTIFGMSPAPLERARILELGCASGGNIVRFAANYPKSHTIGVDLSKIEIEHGNKIINDLELKNIELKHLSILDIDESFGKFDYIISHGVFSWVPDNVRDKILEISKKLLNPQGVVFISYNTLPGWNTVNSIRDMMLFHASGFQSGRDKVTQAKLFLQFVNESLQETNTHYSKFLEEETKLLLQRTDDYIRHDHLSEDNKQFYFHQFIAAAQASGLSYLGDSTLSSMFHGNLPSKAAQKLAEVKNIVAMEQYMDFISNRRFRCTLLCHNNVTLNKNITSDTMQNFYTISNILPEKPENEVDLDNNIDALKFYQDEKQKSIFLSTTSPSMKAIMYTYADNVGNPLKLDEVCKLANKKLAQFKQEDFEQELNSNIATLVFKGVISIVATKPKSVFKISEKPKVSELVQYQIKNGSSSVTNQMNDLISLNVPHKFIITLLDGKHNLDQITDHILAKLSSGELLAHDQENKQITDQKAFKGLAKEFVDNALNQFKHLYLLVG
jgi:methyltransferase-like protein/cyclopropane fatty-acyl-phospholipid synthase-like methyltransferase